MECQMCGEEATIKSDRGNLILCQSCFDDWTQENEQIDTHIKNGHSHHCACRQVWGDGECECELYKKGYNPYAWMRFFA